MPIRRYVHSEAHLSKDQGSIRGSKNYPALTSLDLTEKPRNKTNLSKERKIIALEGLVEDGINSIIF
jgi:hypothetical protein